MNGQKYTIKRQIEYIQNELKEIYPEEEIFPMTTLLFKKILNYSFTDIQVHLNEPVSEDIN